MRKCRWHFRFLLLAFITCQMMQTNKMADFNGAWKRESIRLSPGATGMQRCPWVRLLYENPLPASRLVPKQFYSRAGWVRCVWCSIFAWRVQMLLLNPSSSPEIQLMSQPVADACQPRFQSALLSHLPPLEGCVRALWYFSLECDDSCLFRSRENIYILKAITDLR